MSEALHRVNGHEMMRVKTYDSGGALFECAECLTREAVLEEEDIGDYLGLVLPDTCHIEWLREPDGGYRGVALRNAGAFAGRELINADSDGNVESRVRVYDKDAPLLAGMLDKSEWERRER